MPRITLVRTVFCCCFLLCGVVSAEPVTVIRANQIGYLPDDPKIAILSSSEPQSGRFTVGTFAGEIGPDEGAWGPFKHNYRLDFTALKTPGRYAIEAAGAKSLPFDVGPNVYDDVPKK